MKTCRSCAKFSSFDKCAYAYNMELNDLWAELCKNFKSSQDPLALYHEMSSLDLLEMTSKVTPDKLTYIAEALGYKHNDSKILYTLLGFLWHPSPVVREGAIYGLRNYKNFRTVQDVIGLLSEFDPSPGVKAAAKEWLENKG
jgi:hypothetical protein